MNSARIRRWTAAVAVVGLLASALPAGAKERSEEKQSALGGGLVAVWRGAMQVVAGWFVFKEGECGAMIDPGGRCQSTPTSPVTQSTKSGECGSAIDPDGRCHP